jgi:hypothetical protein
LDGPLPQGGLCQYTTTPHKSDLKKKRNPSEGNYRLSEILADFDRVKRIPLQASYSRSTGRTNKSNDLRCFAQSSRLSFALNSRKESKLERIGRVTH